AADLIGRLLVIEPSKRLGYQGWGELKSHLFFKNIDWDTVLTTSMDDIFVPRPESLVDTFYFGDFAVDIKKGRKSPVMGEKDWKSERFHFTNAAGLEKQNRALIIATAKRHQQDNDQGTDSDENVRNGPMMSPPKISPMNLFGKLEGDYISKLDPELCRRVLQRLSERDDESSTMVREIVISEMLSVPLGGAAAAVRKGVQKPSPRMHLPTIHSLAQIHDLPERHTRIGNHTVGGSFVFPSQKKNIVNTSSSQRLDPLPDKSPLSRSTPARSMRSTSSMRSINAPLSPRDTHREANHQGAAHISPRMDSPLLKNRRKSASDVNLAPTELPEKEEKTEGSTSLSPEMNKGPSLNMRWSTSSPAISPLKSLDSLRSSIRDDDELFDELDMSTPPRKGSPVLT
ncbi:hypothetical protein PROFUN_07099, partial [Planoprotostelium fungivorum]